MAEKSLHIETLTQHLDDTNTKWVIKRSSIGGRGLFSTKPIQRGTLIFSNKPLVIGPRLDRAGDKYCSNCYKISDCCYACDKCSLLVCSEEYKTSASHVEECTFIADHWMQKTEKDRKEDKQSEILARILIYLRFLLLNEEQKHLLFMFQKRNAQFNVEELKTLYAEYEIPDNHKQLMNLSSSVIKINSFRIANNPQEKKIPLRGLYPLSAFLNHSCVPNTRNVFTEDLTMAVYASRDIEIGEELLTCYTGLLWSTPARRCQLYMMKHFWCKCKRCGDNTEMGTNLSALKCLNRECIGVLLPVLPLDPSTEWRCDNCAVEVSATKISSVQSVLGSLVGTLDLDDHFHFETFVLERLADFVPYTSHIFVDLRLRLALKLGFAEGLSMKELSDCRLQLKESLCRGTLRTLAALGVGDAHLRGLLLYHLHAALAERARRCPDLYEDLKSEIERTIDQAYSILQGDISAPPDLELRRRYLGPGCDKSQEERFFILDV